MTFEADTSSRVRDKVSLRHYRLLAPLAKAVLGFASPRERRKEVDATISRAESRSG